MAPQIPVYESGKILTAAQLNQMWRAYCALRLLGFIEATGLPKSEFNIGDLTAIVNGSLVGDQLVREGTGLKVYTSAGVLIDEIDWELLIQATTTNKGLFLAHKYWIEGGVPSSNIANPDEQVDLTDLKCIAQDGVTNLEISAATADLTNHITPAADTTYHLFAYHDTNGDDILDFSTSPTPTVGTGDANLPDLDGTKYRLIMSYKTDGSGDLRFHECESIGGSGIRMRHNHFSIFTGITTNYVAYNAGTPNGVKCFPKVRIVCFFGSGDGTSITYVRRASTGVGAVETILDTNSSSNSNNHNSYQINDMWTNTGTIELYNDVNGVAVDTNGDLNGYDFYRNQY